MIAMLKDLEGMDLELMGKAALIMFFVMFVLAVFYAWTRKRKQLEDWSLIPLLSDDQPEHRKEHQP